jgi:hypothetical protein
VNSRILKLWSAHPFALITELGLFVAFALSLYVMANLPSVVSAWAMVPHILCNGIVAVLIVRHRLLGRPAMYWSHLDAVVILMFLYFLANIYYSEIRAVSWQTAALYLDAMAAYLLGRMMFYHRVRAYALVLCGSLLVAWLGLYANEHRALKLEKSYHAQAETLLANTPAGMDESEANRQADELYKKADEQASAAQRYEPVQRAYLLLLCFWGASLIFLWLEKPTSLAFLVYGGGVVGLYAFYVVGRLAWALGSDNTAAEITMRNAKFESLRTALRLFESYPITGSGLGTFPAMFDAYRLTPAATYGTGFNAFLYCAVETGIVGVLLLFYFMLRLPLHVVRRWKLFPNRRLRFAVWVHLIFFGLFALQCFHDADMFQPAVWFPVWACIGTFVSLVMVRDPVRVFDLLLPAARSHDPQAINRRVVYSSLGGVFGRTPLAKLPRPRVSIFKRLGISQFVLASLLACLVVALCALEAAPYVARALATPNAASNPNATAETLKTELASPSYASNLNAALKVFPLDSHLWSALASHFESSITEPLEIYKYSDRIEDAYMKAIKHNPFRPELYEKLYFLYRDINRQGDALDIMKQGVETNPNQLILRLLLIRELERLGNYPLATWHEKQALFAIAPGETELYLRLAELYEIQGQYDDAKLYYLYSRQIVPETPQTVQRLNRLKEHLGM